ncbi:hypothetical protein [Variovorax soli]|uniref:hypothetical protein n=1 Tax=Variovorax soli TaxID=376815 RepID=UPI00286B5A6E|nr:hypothetical protein [Variovorax soli]
MGDLLNDKARQRKTAQRLHDNLHGCYQQPGPYQNADVLEKTIVRQDQGQGLEGDTAQQRKGRRAPHVSLPCSIVGSRKS